MPRLDGFLDENKIQNFKNEFYKEYPNLQSKKIILFAPTYRGDGQKTANYNYDWLDLKEIYDFCGEEMMRALRNKDYEIEKVHQFVKDNYDEYDGHAADKAIDAILLKK